MTNSNERTLASYQEHIQEYVDSTDHEISDFVKSWMREALAPIPQGATVLELGSGFGRDAAYIESLGLKVQKSDATQGFVDLLRKQGQDALSINILTDTIDGPYQAILAHAVLLHFTPEEFNIALDKIHHSLTPDGIFFFTVQRGNGSEWKSNKGGPRFFQYWQPKELERAVNVAGLKVLNLYPDSADKWIHVIAQK